MNDIEILSEYTAGVAADHIVGRVGDLEHRPDLHERARDLAPGIAARAAEAEELRNVPDDTMQELIDAGLFRMLQPKRRS